MFIGIGIGLTTQLQSIAPDAPSDIDDLTATTASDTEILLEFTPAGGASSHEYRTDGGSWAATDDNSGVQLVGGLDPETEYDFEVRGVNDVGDGDASNVATATTEATAVDSTAPVLTLAVGTQTGPTTATVGATTDEANGALYYVVTTSASAPTKAQVKAGQDHTGAAAADDGSQAIVSAGAKTFNVTGLTHTTAYYAHLMHEDVATNQSNVVSSAQFTTAAAPDVTAPVLSSPTATQTGTTTADLGVTSDEANGTLYVSVLPSASAAPDAAAFIAGTTGGVYTASDATPVVGVNSFSATGLTAGTAYKAHYFQRDAATNNSNVVSSAEFTTSASGSLDESITPLVISLAVEFDEYPVQITAAFDLTHAVGDTVVVTQYSDARGTTIVDTYEHTITLAEATADPPAASIGLTAIVAGTNWLDAIIRKPNDDYSAPSNRIIHGEAVDTTPASFSFTDQNDVALSTLITGAAVQLISFNQPVAATSTGGTFATSPDNVTYSSFATSHTVYPNDYIKPQQTSSGSEGTATNTIVTVGGVSDTFTTTTEVSEPADPWEGLWTTIVDPSNVAGNYQAISASGDLADADGDPVGYVTDLSGNGNHWRAAAATGVRPTLDITGSVHSFVFDGTDDYLRLAADAALGSYAAGSCTMVVAVKCNPANTAALIASGNTADNDSAYMFREYTATATGELEGFFRNDAATQLVLSANGAITQTATNPPAALDNNYRVIVIVDTGSAVTCYVDGVEQTTRTYTRSGAVTLNRTSLFAWLRSTVGSFMAGELQWFACRNGTAANDAEADSLKDYPAFKQGRTL